MKLITLRLLLLTLLPLTCAAESALNYRLGTMGFGLEYALPLRDSLSLRLGYNLYVLKRSVDDGGVNYRASIKINAASAIVDWQFNPSPWRVSAGLVQSGPFAEASGTPTGSSVTINGQVYSAADLGSINVKIKGHNAVAPYVGLGWGKSVGAADRFSLLAEFGALYTGAPKSSVNANCSPAIAASGCDQLVADIKAEAATQEHEWRHLQWWPVLAVGFAMQWQ